MRLKAAVLVLAVVLATGAVTAQQGPTAAEALQSLENARQSIAHMEEAGIPTQRVKDLYAQANATFQSENESSDPDYTGVIQTAERIGELENLAFRVHDELSVLNDTVQQLRQAGLNTSEVEQHFDNARLEFRNERFESAQEQIDETYNAVSNARALSTRAAAFSEAARQDIASFIRENKWRLSGGGIAVLLFGFLGYREFHAYRLIRRRKKLKKRKEVLEDLIAESQQEYFEEGELPEETYQTRMDKYGEMIRDINRQLPVIDEELEGTLTLVSELYG